MNKIRNILIAVLVVGVFASIIWIGYVDQSYGASMPRSPEAQSGRVYPLRVDGVLVYVTQKELARRGSAFKESAAVSILCVVALALIKVYSKGSA